MSKGIAFFDFDGTITRKDTLLEFIKFYKGSFAFFTGFLINSPLLIAYKLNLIPNYVAKQKVLRHFFFKEPAQIFRQRCFEFATQKLPALIRPPATEEIKKLQQNNITVVVVSASIEDWIKPWCDQMNVSLIATQLEVRDEKFSHNIIGFNCHGQEKVRRIKEHYQLSDYDEVYVYGDTTGDKAMLELAHKSYYKPFRV